MQMPTRLLSQLEKRKIDNSFRTLKTTHNLVDFSSNDYLGLANNQSLNKLIVSKSLDLKNGATGSRLLTGNSKLCESLEHKLATFYKSESALLFNAGYAANLGVLSSIPQRGDIIFYDELSHASIKDGIRLSMANKVTFKHNNLQDLKNKLEKSPTNTTLYVVVEAIYSMDGDQANLDELVSLCQQFNAYLIVDEAHSTGLYPTNGCGLSDASDLQSAIFCRIYTFGKAMGVHGALVCGSNELIQFLINFSRPFIYTTAMPDHSLVAIDGAHDYWKNNTHLVKKLNENIALFNTLFEEKLASKYFKTISEHAIQTILVPGNNKVKNLSDYLAKNGFDARAILSPTVPQGKERIRICLHSFNTHEQISALIDSLAAYL